MRWKEAQQCGLNRVKLQQLLVEQQIKTQAERILRMSRIPIPQLKLCGLSAMRESHTSCATQ